MRSAAPLDMLVSDVSAKDVVETVPSGLLVLGADLRVTSANRAFFRMFDVDPEETIGRAVYDLGNGQWDIPALRLLLEEVIPKEEVIEGFEVEHDFETIGRRCLLLNARKVFRPGHPAPFLVLAFEDITEARKLRIESELNWRLAQNIVDTVRDPLVILEKDRTVVMASRSFLLLFGASGADVVGRRLHDLGEGQWNVNALKDLLARITQEDASFDGFEIEDDFPHLGRRIFKLNARNVFSPDNLSARLLLVFEDVTEARLLERHRELLTAELAHRIKNSLQIVNAFVSFEMRTAPPECYESFHAIQTRISAIAELYDVISRSASLGPVPMAPYLNGIASSLRASLLGNQSHIHVIVETEALHIVSEHALTVGLIVNELATNAVKHAFPDRTGNIVIGFRKLDGEVHLTVRDDGVGLKEIAKNPGTGLGSRFVEAFVSQLGGTLAKASGPSGTTMTVKLPGSVLSDQ